MQVSGGPRPPRGTLTQLFFEAIEKYDLPDAWLVRDSTGTWNPVSHREVRDRVRHIALALSSLGTTQRDRVAILSENRLEWSLADWAALTMRATDVPVYASLPAAQIPYLLNDSGSSVIFVSTVEQAGKIASIRGEIPGVRLMIGFDADTEAMVDLTLAELERRGRELDSAEARAQYESIAKSVQPDDLATLVYTSGTTGNPKGVMLSHDNLMSNVQATAQVVPSVGKERALSFLPLSHVLQRLGDYWYLQRGTAIGHVPEIDLVSAAMMEVRPTITMSVPRLYEKMYARVLENAVAGGALKMRIFNWARRTGERWADEKLAGRTPSGLLALQYRIAVALVFSKLQARTGGRLRYFVSGGAPLAPELGKFFYAAGLPILEGYGLTETSPVISVNAPDSLRIGTVGPPVAGTEVRIAEDGEILARGPLIMMGYYNNPEATAEVIDADGWFHTGDIGVIDNGHLRITDRKKDIIVTSGGKNIAPQPIETMIKSNKYVSQVVMIGDRRKFPVVLVVPDFEQLARWAAIKQLTWSTHTELVALPIVQAKMEKEVLGRLTSLASYETPKKVGILDREFTIDGGELTPKMSVKRKFVMQRHADLIESLYAGD